MSKATWRNSQTTQGHGIFSQYKPDHLKEWIMKENRRLEISKSPERNTYQEKRSLHHASLNDPFLPSLHIEPRHDAMPASLQELREIQHPTSMKNQVSRDPKTTQLPAVTQPFQKPFLPQFSHHHHFGWNAPTPESRYGSLDPTSVNHSYQYGIANQTNQKITNTLSLISSRRP